MRTNCVTTPLWTCKPARPLQTSPSGPKCRKSLEIEYSYEKKRKTSRKVFKPSLLFPTVREAHKQRVTTPEKPQKILRTPAEPRRDPAEPSQRPRRALRETPAEPSERQISSKSLAEGCAPRMVTLRNFRTL